MSYYVPIVIEKYMLVLYRFNQCVAQLVAWEPWTLQVAGSSPAALTKFAEIAETD